MTREEAIEKLKLIQKNSDTENTHYEADQLLCKLLTDFGYEDVVYEYERVSKWYDKQHKKEPKDV